MPKADGVSQRAGAVPQDEHRARDRSDQFRARCSRAITSPPPLRRSHRPPKAGGRPEHAQRRCARRRPGHGGVTKAPDGTFTSDERCARRACCRALPSIRIAVARVRTRSRIASCAASGTHTGPTVLRDGDRDRRLVDVHADKCGAAHRTRSPCRRRGTGQPGATLARCTLRSRPPVSGRKHRV